jgi:hypothetical protein
MNEIILPRFDAFNDDDFFVNDLLAKYRPPMHQKAFNFASFFLTSLLPLLL